MSIYGLQGQDFIAVDKQPQPQPLLSAGTMMNKAFINSHFNPQFNKLIFLVLMYRKMWKSLVKSNTEVNGFSDLKGCLDYS